MSCEHCTDPDVIVKAGLDAILAWIQKGADELLIRRIWDDVRRAMLEAGKQSDVILVDPIREATMEQSFDYFSILTKETFWRPIGKLFDGRFEFITMEELCSTN